VFQALGHSAALWVGLIIVGLVMDRLRPDELADRGFLSTPFLWTAALWTGVLLFHAVVFDESQVRRLDRSPLAVAAALGSVTFALGLRGLRGVGDVARRLLYVAANALGAVVFWWSVTSLVLLLILWVTPARD